MRLKILRAPTTERLEELFDQFASKLDPDDIIETQLVNDGVAYLCAVWYTGDAE